MKKIIILFYASAFLIIGCKKNVANVSKDIKTQVYSGKPNTEDAVIATAVFNNSNVKMFVNGSFNERGLPVKPKSIVIEDKDNFIRANYIFDDSMRMQYLYASNLNGENDNILMQFSYPSKDTLIQRIYNYNWVTGQDSLMVEQHIDIVNWRSHFTYGRTSGSVLGIQFSTEAEDQMLRDEGFGGIIEQLPVFEDGVARSFASNKFNTFTAALIKGISKVLDLAVDANTGIKRGLNNLIEYLDKKRDAFRAGTDDGTIQEYENVSDYIRPPSPTFDKDKIPDPKGTPIKPVGNSRGAFDIDGNLYHTIKIGTQTWMVENLKTTRYNDGTIISNGLDNAAWRDAVVGAYCIYDNNVANNTTYGKLYNWYAVNTGKLAPTGWHVPTDAEWTTLTTYLGGETVAGGKLKSTSNLWSAPNTGATNSSGFTILPAGLRNFADGKFYYIGMFTEFWSSTYTYDPIGRHLGFTSSSIDGRYEGMADGLSVRCIKN